jgi:hypothetical protein
MTICANSKAGDRGSDPRQDSGEQGRCQYEQDPAVRENCDDRTIRRLVHERNVSSPQRWLDQLVVAGPGQY